MHTRRTPRAARALGLAAAGLSFALYAQTVGLTPGLYEFTITTDIQLPPDMAAKMPPQALAMMQKPNVTQHCISQGDVDHVSQEISQGRNNQPESCTVTEHSISGSEVRFTTQCQHHTAHFEGSFAGDSFKGTVVSTGDKGQNVTAKIAARRIGDCSK
ncbi:MAG TPA: DUF3617 family protein [Steroidobacteraceae bacterium]|nr:DUF3617 family protein [Gammaproteobacteria bacterium]HEV2285435.1 DUF3617 family protein [Steroidobacteraceae bacterium]